MNTVFLILFFVFTFWHLVDSWRNDARRRAMTKPFPLLLLTLYYCFTADPISWLLVAALLTSWLGDVLLIPKGHKWFRIGGRSFLISHILFILVYIPAIDFSRIPWLLIVPLAAIYIAVSLAIIKAIKPTTPEAMVKPMYYYLLTNSTMNIFALMQLLTVRNLAGIVAYAGAILFFISDCTLFLVRYHGNKDLIFKKHFTVMLTYLFGELFITLGILMLAA